MEPKYLAEIGGERYRKNNPCSSSDVSVVGSIGAQYSLPFSSWWFFPTHLKNMPTSNWSISPNFGMNIKNLWNHQPILPFWCVFPWWFAQHIRRSKHLRRRSHWSVQRCRGSLRSLGSVGSYPWDRCYRYLVPSQAGALQQGGYISNK